MKRLVFVAIAGLVCQANAFMKSEVSNIQDPSVVCNDCKVLFQDIKHLIQSDQSKNTTTTAVLSLVCGEPYQDPVYVFCSNLVATAVPLAIQALADIVDPTQACVSLYLCGPPPPPNGLVQDLKLDPAFASAIMKKITQHLKQY